jgi:anti-sigma factor RsiW
MSDDTHRHVEHLLGGYALGQLGPDEQTLVQAHLAWCASCNDALDEVLPVARLLPMADLERVLHKPIVSPHVETELFQKIASEKRRQRRVSTASFGALAVAAAVIVALLLVPMVASDSQPGQNLAFADVPANTKANARIVEQSWGTEIHLDVAGLSGRQTVWFEQPDGTRASAGSFEANGGEVQLVLSTAFRADKAVALCVSPPDKPAVLRAPLSA